MIKNQGGVVTSMPNNATLQETIQQNVSSVVQPTQQTVIAIDFWTGVIGLIGILIAFAVSWGKIHTDVKHLKKGIDGVGKKFDGLNKELSSAYERIVRVETRVDTIWKDDYAPAQSPRKLNERGLAVLNTSGIKDIVDKYKDKLREIVASKKPRNAYRAEGAVMSVMRELPELFPDVVDALENGAFRSGVNVDVVLFVGSIYLRDLIFDDLGFSIDDIDKTNENSEGTDTTSVCCN